MTDSPPAKDQDKFVLRLPEGMRDRIKASADRNGRSMNAEMVQALEEHFPPEPSLIEILDRVHRAIEQAKTARTLPYRDTLVKALDQLSERLSSGLEFDQYQSRTLPPEAVGIAGLAERLERWRRVQDVGVDQRDLEREIARGLVRKMGGNNTSAAIQMFKEGKPERALGILRLDRVKFADPDAAHRAIEADLRAYYADNWGDPDVPWEPDD